MTVATTANKVTYTGNGSATSFAFNFEVPDASHLVVTVTNTDTGVVTTLSSANYSVTGIGDESGGSLTYPLSGDPLASNQRITIKRVLPYTQDLDIVNQAGFFPNTLEAQLDDIVMQIQQAVNVTDGALVVPDQDTAASLELPLDTLRASKIFGFDASGQPIALSSFPAGETYDTVATLEAAKVGSGVDGVRTAGYSAVGDGGGALYKRVGSEPSHAFKVQSADGAWWEGVLANRSVDLRVFGVVADSDGTAGNGTDNTAALQAVSTYLSGRSGIRVTGPDGIVRFTAPDDGDVFALASSNGIFFDLSGAEFFDDKTYTSSVTSDLFKMTDCKQIGVRFKKVTTENQDPETTAGDTGLDVVGLFQGCEHVKVVGEIAGGRNGVAAIRDLPGGDPESYRSRHIDVDLICTNTVYPLSGQFSGDHVRGRIELVGCGRTYVVYGVRDWLVTVKTNSQKKSAKLSARAGATTEDICILYEDSDGNGTYVAGGSLVEFGFGTTTASVLRNIDLRFNLIAPATDVWGATLRFQKTDDAAAADTADRGHKIDGFRLSGYMDLSSGGGNALAQLEGAMHSNETVTRFNFDGLTVLGNSNISLDSFLPTSAEDFVFTNVRCHTVFWSGPASFRSCRTQREMDSGTARHVYENCEIADGGGLQTFDNKTFLGTVVGSTTYNPVNRVRKTSIESVNNSATLQDDDELKFHIPANTNGYFRLGLRVKSDATADFKFTVNGPSGMSATFSLMNSEVNTQNNKSGAVSIAMPDTSVYWVYVSGAFANGSTAGDLILQWAQDTATVVDTTVRDNSYLEVIFE